MEYVQKGIANKDEVAHLFLPGTQAWQQQKDFEASLCSKEAGLVVLHHQDDGWSKSF